MMMTSTFLAASLALASPVAVQMDASGTGGSLIVAAADGEAGCRLEPGTWLPGTLEIKERSASAPEQGQRRGPDADPLLRDCDWA